MLFHATGLRGGCDTIPAQDMAHQRPSMCLIPLWLATFKRPLRFGRGRKAGTRAPPPKWGVMRSQKEVLCGTPLFGRMTGRFRPHLSLREGLEQPPFPLALHRVGSVLAVKGSLRRFAPWTAPGPIRKTRCLRGERGGSGRGVRGRVASPLVHDKGYYHAYLGRTRRKGPFGHTSHLSRSRGALSPVGP